MADRGNHKLNLWDIELRDPLLHENGEVTTNSDKEVWVRRAVQS